MLEFVEDIARYEAFHSSPGEVAIVSELLQEVECVDHILWKVNGLVLCSYLGLHHRTHILASVHKELLNVLRVELSQESNGSSHKWRSIQRLTL